ncbi:hypothetical protein NPIL_274771 [Nephila pilipes]|uniref:Uncharacterized protein n=1 Tax=Nephila pilipes TaxID=299642 RepID=A0A8X6PMA2_NEPPI|nr:hypothetical protein NPIL_274771 [Nephila pilipes]
MDNHNIGLYRSHSLPKAGKNKIFIKKDPNGIETIRNILLCHSDEQEDIVLDENDTDEEEHISGREDDSESE